MAIIVTPTWNKAKYEDLRYELIREVEESGREEPHVYLDTVGVLTIGVGFSLLNKGTVEEVLNTENMGVPDFPQIQHEGVTLSIHLSEPQADIIAESNITVTGFKDEINALTWVAKTVTHNVN